MWPTTGRHEDELVVVAAELTVHPPERFGQIDPVDLHGRAKERHRHGHVKRCRDALA